MLLFALMAACTSLSGFGQVANATFVEFDSADGQIGAYAMFTASKNACKASPHSSGSVGGGGGDVPLCAALAEIIPQGSDGSIWASSDRSDMLNVNWLLADGPLIGTATDLVSFAPCYGPGEATGEVESMDATVTIEDIQDSTATLAFEGDVSGEIQANLCAPVSVE